MSVNKKITQIQKKIVVEIEMKLNNVFSDEFSEIITELCYQHLAKGFFEGKIFEGPEQLENSVISDAKTPVEIALKKKIRETFAEIATEEPEKIMEEIKERFGVNA